MLKINVKTVLSITGTVLGVAATVVQGIAADKKMKDEVTKQVAKALQK